MTNVVNFAEYKQNTKREQPYVPSNPEQTFCDFLYENGLSGYTTINYIIEDDLIE